MRLWHKDLIPVLPRQQLLGQWRECCLIAKNIAEKGTPNHILVNKVMDYPIEHFLRYTELIQIEMENRGYKANLSKFNKYFINLPCDYFNIVSHDELYADWHSKRYLTQCVYNLQEKYDCGGISENEWVKLATFLMNKEFDEALEKTAQKFNEGMYTHE